MATVEQPITRSELRDELAVHLQHYATKADLAKLEVKIERMTWALLSAMVAVGGLVVAILKLTE